MPELWGAPLPVWAIIIISLFAFNPNFTNLLKRMLATVGIIAKQEKEADLETERWMRQRADWAADTAFDILKTTIESYREESKDRDRILADLIAALNRNTNITAKQTDMIRILSQNSAQASDKLDNIHTRLLIGDK